MANFIITTFLYFFSLLVEKGKGRAMGGGEGKTDGTGQGLPSGGKWPAGWAGS